MSTTSTSRRDSLSLSNSNTELKQRVITCLNKLSDRDTLLLATSELDSIARNLTHDSFSPFLSCIHSTDSSEKCPVRKQCVKILTLLSQVHGNDLSPHLSKMLSTVVKRLKDTDTAVRSTCVEAVASMSLHVTKPSFLIFVKAFMEVMSVEQDYSSQLGSAMCLSAAIEAAPDPEPGQLGKVIPKLLKLTKSECFKAKPALLGLIGSVVGARAGGGRVLECLVTCGVEFLSSEDWVARKAAAEMLGKLAVVVEVKEQKLSCLASLESRRFDKVKAVREAMNRSLELWKEVPGVAEEISTPSQSKSASRDIGSGGCSPPASRNSQGAGSITPQSKRISLGSSRSPQSSNSLPVSTKKPSPTKNNDRKSNVTIIRNSNGNSNWKVEVATPHIPSSKVALEDDLRKGESRVPQPEENGNIGIPKPDTKRGFFSKVDDKTHKFGGLISGSRVFPFPQEDDSKQVMDSSLTDEVYEDQNDIEDLSLIRKQLVQIENQQSSLLNLLQRYMGSSQNGINSLESRVHGLEMALDEISHDLAISTGRISNDTCCKLPGTEFLSPKFWRRTEGRYSSSRSYSSGIIQSPGSTFHMSDKDVSNETYKAENHRFRTQNNGEHVNQLEYTRDDAMDNLDFSNRSRRNINVAARGSCSQGWGA